ncbi:TPA: HypC/HybG/HupF family hydrogenase formation chaperone [Burkholderia vietnamiensis]|nr:HypC/HybG/HupF family hydrogenase formation chaperone [Burkholderia vietnamiensis]HDR8977223.1 HypC/HybG/HupF family hydrogenase formation chaperone [Burkholderia vietnamiensis]
MCIGLPMQVVDAQPGHAWCVGRGVRRRVDTALVGPCAPGDWLLVFIDAARERLDAARAAEIDATLALIESVMAGEGGAASPAAFALPSALGVDELNRLVGGPQRAAGSLAVPEESK